MVPSFGKRVLLFLNVELIEEFHPVFFVSFLGTGITGNILYGFPYPAQWLKSPWYNYVLSNGVTICASDNLFSCFLGLLSAEDIPISHRSNTIYIFCSILYGV